MNAERRGRALRSTAARLRLPLCRTTAPTRSRCTASARGGRNAARRRNERKQQQTDRLCHSAAQPASTSATEGPAGHPDGRDGEVDDRSIRDKWDLSGSVRRVQGG